VRRIPIIISLLLLFSLSTHAQSFSSGSTGADGPFNCSQSQVVCDVQLPESGILNYTTVNVEGSSIVKFKRNFRNTPVIMLAQGNVVIAGQINVSPPFASQQTPGPGGFFGGDVGQSGLGPGGGPSCCSNACQGRWVGSLSLVPIVGGSGGGGCTVFQGGSATGGGGGGAIVIASSASIE
jgi:hypothetical protein